MAQAEAREILSVDKDKLFAVIIGYEEYPKFVAGCSSVKVERKGPGKARVTYHVSMMKDITYTLDMVEHPESGKVEWTLVESEFMKKNSGHWTLKSAGPGKTEAHYEVEVEFKFPVPSLILNRVVKGSLPPMIRSFEERAKAAK